jgi:hypothetical protein
MKCVVATGIALFREIFYDRPDQSMFDGAHESFRFEEDQAPRAAS